MGSWIAIVCVGVLLLINCAVAAEDARFTNPADKDHPADFTGEFAVRAAWEKRARFLRHQALVALGLWPPPVKTPIEPVIWGQIDRDGYSVEKVFFASLPGHYVTGNLYRPHGRRGKVPGILCPYGHWPNGRFIWKSDQEIDKDLAGGGELTREAAKSPLQAQCAMLARMGCVVFMYDLVGYCDSKSIEHRQGFTDAESILRLQTFMGLQSWNGIRALDFIASLPEVDTQRLAVTGASGGGTATIMLSIAERERLAGAFPVVMVSMNMQGGCVCENAPLLRVGANNVELATLFAPKPQGAAAAKDWTHDFETRGLPQMKNVYGLFDAAEMVEGKFLPYPHNYNLHSRELMYDFMNRTLKLDQPTPVKEKPFKPIPPDQLSVLDDAHPLPKDATDAAGVRKWMTQTSDAQVQALAGDLREYERTVRVALEAMVVDSLPSNDAVRFADQNPREEGWTGFIAREGTHERIPARTIFPPDWNGDLIIWSDPSGSGSLVGNDGKPVPLVQKVLDRKYGVLAVDVFMSGSFRPSKPADAPATQAKPGPNPPYAGFALTFNRSVVANRVHDLLTAIALARSLGKTRSVHLLGIGEAGPSVLLAKALAGEAVARAAIDLNHFDFDQVKKDDDPMLLPGGLKFGGIYGFVPLCSTGETLLCNARKTGQYDLAAQNPRVTLEETGRSADSLCDWLLR